MAQQLNPRPDEVAAAEVAAPPEVPAELQPVYNELTELRRAVNLLKDLAGELHEPAQPVHVSLTKATPRKTVREHGMTTASIGILNPTAVVILIGIGGAVASSQARAISVPPQSLLVLPVSAGDVEIATEAELGEDTAVVHVFRYRTVQSAFLGGV